MTPDEEIYKEAKIINPVHVRKSISIEQILTKCKSNDSLDESN